MEHLTSPFAHCTLLLRAEHPDLAQLKSDCYAIAVGMVDVIPDDLRKKTEFANRNNAMVQSTVTLAVSKIASEMRRKRHQHQRLAGNSGSETDVDASDFGGDGSPGTTASRGLPGDGQD